ncbi:solute carrier organic anion transporter family member 2A1-like isoform X2 [Acanthaster planci]|nr:solute carrier organic anion transporter family member 2A1-like isoform X2 [Acanthaster planci]
MSDPDIDRQDSRAPLKDNTAAADDDAIVDVTSSSEPGGETELVCGVGPCRPRRLQWLAGGPKAFALWSMMYLLIKTSATVYLGSVVSTIEKQFKLSSTESGAIIILNDALDMALVIFVAYFGHKGHRPRIIGVGILLSGLGIFLCSVPHFMLDPYTRVPLGCNETEPFVDYCSADAKDKIDPCNVEYEQPGFNPVSWLIIGQILLGIGNVPMKPLGTTYIDDAVGKHTTPIYIAFLFIAVSIGPLLGFGLGSAALSLFVDFDRVAQEDRPPVDQNDPRFIGAWWLGFACLGVAVTLIGVPFFFFPRMLPKSKERQKEEKEAKEKELEASEDNGIQMKRLPEDEVNGEAGKEVKEKSNVKEKGPIHKTFFSSVKGMFFTYLKIVMNIGLLLLCISSAMEGANAAALGAFALKYYNVEFAVSASLSSLLAIAVFPFNLIGSLVGGCIIKWRKWSPAKCALFLLFGDVVSILGVPAFLVMGCQTQAIAGVSTEYAPPAPYNMIPPLPEMPVTHLDSVQMARSVCNSNCTCGDEDYNPVCGSDGLTYVSPCYAGCEVVIKGTDEFNRTIYSFDDCRCINPVTGYANATDGECSADCQSWHIPVLIIVSIIITFCGGLGQSGLVLITLRIVEEDMRSAALGFQSVFLNLLGFFPAPVYFGALINLACILWAYEGDSRGNCLVYDRDNIRYAFHGMQGALKVVASVFFIGVFLVLRDPKGKKYKSQEEEKTEQIT